VALQPVTRKETLSGEVFVIINVTEPLVMGNILKSLSPNDKFLNAINDLAALLNAETSVVGAQVNKRTWDIKEGVERLEENMSRLLSRIPDGNTL
jgi:hypothetical protein